MALAVAPVALLPILLLFGGFSLPAGLPPLPEDRVISRVAPAECLGYISWAGTATPNANSKNQTEQLLAEPEVQKLLAGIDSAIAAGIDQGAQRGAPDSAVVKELYPLGKTLLMRPAAIFLSKFEIGLQGPKVLGGAVFNLGDKTDTVSATLDRLQKLLPPGAVEKVAIDGGTFQQLTAGPAAPPVTWGFRDKYLVVGVGEGQVEDILRRAKGQPPEWLTTLRKQLPVDRVSTVTYINVKQISAEFAPMGGPIAQKLIEALGLGNVSCLTSVTGLDATGKIARTLVAIDGQPQGVFQLAAGKPLAAADLAPIPRDATIAAAGRLDASAALELLLNQSEKIDPSAREQIITRLNELEMGMDLKRDLLAPLGDVWCCYNSPGEGGLLVTGLTGVVKVKDHARLQATLEKLIVDFPGGSGQPVAAGEPRLVKTPFAGQVIYFLDIPHSQLPLALAFCLTQKELIVSTFPQNIKSYLARGKDFESLAVVPEVSRALDAGAVGLTYCDTRKLAEMAYPLLCLGSKVFCTELNQSGIPLDCSLMPSAAAIFPHLQPSLGVIRRTSAGIEMVDRGPVAGVGLAPMLTLPMFFFVARTEHLPGNARTMSMNNLKQIALAVLNYESTFNSFPRAYTSDKTTDKPLLSCA